MEYSNKRIKNSAPTINGADKKPTDENHTSSIRNGAISALAESIDRITIRDDNSDCASNISDESQSAKDTEKNEKGILRKRVVKKRKSVHFADTSGKVLATVKSFTKEGISVEGVNKIPRVNKADGAKEKISDAGNNPHFRNHVSNCYNTTNSRRTILLEINFDQPAVQKDFHIMLRKNLVKLENAIINKNICTGTIKVRNIAFEKKVFVRYTFDRWKNWKDLQAKYYPNSCTGYTDTFTFSIVVPEEDVKDVEFAICFYCQGNQYWDNNSGKNYCINCSPVWIRV